MTRSRTRVWISRTRQGPVRFCHPSTCTDEMRHSHHMMYLALDDQLFLAPLENPQKVLDLATGTGIWAV